MSRRIFILRHGETLFNSQRKLQGHCDSPLTELGVSQARSVGATLKSFLTPGKFDIYVSPLGRAIQTAQLICDEINVSYDALISEPRIKEYSLGDWEEHHITDLIEQTPELFEQRDWFIHAPNGESYNDVTQRLTDWLDDLSNDERDVVVISHGLTGLTLRGMLTAQAYDDIWQQTIPQDAFFIAQDGQLERVNCVLDEVES
ncbi:histidine phosphatase family protein [Vibrio nitrifigilis]|uniref:Histidine phosphatase family protein n=1 Tax=Vibrio nitrifigilis TaxID=2789781 RepID=A0ABS0GK43_9VIBR|nr:histidine phosphatase family protein [Vibrio nitrifigilis]MBF9002851.1 histidine phosphatase family protein [Vibrio nitrifigilis]